MRLYTSLFLSAYFIVSIHQVQAQTTFSIGPSVGLNVASTHYQRAPFQLGNPTTAYRSGITAGIVASLEYKHVALRPSIQYTTKGFVLNDEYSERVASGQVTSIYHQTYKFNYLMIPVSIAYSQHKKGQGIQAFAGGYVSFLLGGKVYYDNSFVSSSETQVYVDTVPVRGGNEFASSTNDFYTKKLDVGLQAGLGYGWNQLLIQVSYQVGLRNLGASYPNSPISDTKYYNRGFEATASYLVFHSK